ncbi:hypothetical protein QFZ76_000751 [Streptomyces sp. V4I2]|nr:hypothetical protein [Streptomyces sp. V4I2]
MRRIALSAAATTISVSLTGCGALNATANSDDASPTKGNDITVGLLLPERSNRRIRLAHPQPVPNSHPGRAGHHERRRHLPQCAHPFTPARPKSPVTAVNEQPPQRSPIRPKNSRSPPESQGPQHTPGRGSPLTHSGTTASSTGTHSRSPDGTHAQETGSSSRPLTSNSLRARNGACMDDAMLSGWPSPVVRRVRRPDGFVRDTDAGDVRADTAQQPIGPSVARKRPNEPEAMIRDRRRRYTHSK